MKNKRMSTCNAVGTKTGNKAASSPEKKDIRPTVTAGSYCGESESLSHVRLFATLWTIESMELSRPEYWSG